MDSATSAIAAKLSSVVVGHELAISHVAQVIAQWQCEASPRFPLRLMFTGQTSVGKQLLALAIAQALFDGRFAVHSCLSSAGPLRLNPGLQEHRGHPLTLLIKAFDNAPPDELLAAELLLETGGIILGNGRSIHLADSVVVLSASHQFSEQLLAKSAATPLAWDVPLAARYPWAARDIDALIHLGPLSVSDLARIVERTAPDLSRRAGFPIVVTAAAARAIAEEKAPTLGRARHLDEALASLAELAWSRDPTEFERMRADQHTLVIEHAGDDFHVRWLAAGVAPPGSPAADRTPSAANRDERSLADTQRRPRAFPALAWSESPRFDAFISYKIRKHRDAARELRAELARRGCEVWMDEDRIGVAGMIAQTKEQIVNALIDGVAGSRCTIVFEAALEAVALPPGVSRHQVEASGRVMHSSEGALIAWNWQKLEIDSSSRLIAIREGRPRLTITIDGRDVTSTVLETGDVTEYEFFDAVFKAVEWFRRR
jgi:hypothetical protein